MAETGSRSDDERRASRLRRLPSAALTVVIVLGSVLVFGIGLAARTQALHFQTVLSGSMRPTVSPGDVAVTQAVDASDLRIGDVIAFVPPGSTRPVLHRITSLANGVITTRGDANPIEDPWHAVAGGPIAYRLVAVVPLLGWITTVKAPALVLAALLLGLWLLRAIGKEVRARTFARSSRPLS